LTRECRVGFFLGHVSVRIGFSDCPAAYLCAAGFLFITFYKYGFYLSPVQSSDIQ